MGKRLVPTHARVLLQEHTCHIPLPAARRVPCKPAKHPRGPSSDPRRLQTQGAIDLGHTVREGVLLS